MVYTMSETVAIIGAGLGGLAAAIALRQQGIDAQVYEKARELKPVGAGLSLFPNGLRTLQAIAPGIVERLKELGSQVQRVNIKKSTGELVTQNSVSLLQKYQQPMLNIRWSCLQETLAAALSADVIHLNHRCVGFEQSDRQVEIYFDNTTTIQADVLIGADGVHSVVRQLLIGDGSPRYAGRLSWRAIVSRQPDILPENEVTIFTGADGKLFTLIDVGNDCLFWSAGALSPEAILLEQAEMVKSRVLATYVGWANSIQAIAASTPPTAIIERPIYDRPPLQRWSVGRVILLGDAAHPMVPSLGQGANTAFEDAWELAHYLRHQPTLEAAIAQYETSRIYRTQIIQARSAFQGSRSYDSDNEAFLQGVAEQAQTSQAEFEDWLYAYPPSNL
jgi:salicylate hydroxylase